MDRQALDAFRKRLATIESIRPVFHGRQRIQDEKRKVNYPWVYKLLKESRKLVFVQPLPAHPMFPGEDRYKLVFRISRGWGMLIVVSIKEKDLKIITVYKEPVA